jgi:hypothetical protein
MPIPTFTLFAFGGVILFLAGALAREYLRRRLRARGAQLPSWATPSDEVGIYFDYAREARKGHVPWWPIVLTVVGIFGGILLSLTSIIAHNNYW